VGPQKWLPGTVTVRSCQNEDAGHKVCEEWFEARELPGELELLPGVRPGHSSDRKEEGPGEQVVLKITGDWNVPQNAEV